MEIRIRPTPSRACSSAEPPKCISHSSSPLAPFLVGYEWIPDGFDNPREQSGVIVHHIEQFGGFMRNARNFAYGRDMGYAGRQVLRHCFGAGRYGTRQAHGARWNTFAARMRSEYGIRDMRLITGGHVREHVDTRLEDGYAVTTLHNEVSTVNVVLGYATEGIWSSLSPRALVGPRANVRRDAPASYFIDVEQLTYSAMARYPRAMAVFGLARAIGVRSREASLADIRRWMREWELYGAVNVTEGTKGGRGNHIARWVPVTQRGVAALAFARGALPRGSQNLLLTDENYQQWRDGQLRQGREALHQAGVRGYHDGRAAYACDRYQVLTGYQAPAVAGERRAERDVDRNARGVIAGELGHGRVSVTCSYLGSAK